MRPTVLLVDHHEAFRESASAMLEAERFSVVGQAADGMAAIAKTEGLLSAVYFVCSEALANVIKYASATRAAISITERRDRLFVELADDGVSGAVIVGGTGWSDSPIALRRSAAGSTSRARPDGARG